jgi:hypothetical protein
MGVPPMSTTPVRAWLFLLFLFLQDSDNNKDTGRMPVRLMGKMPMLRLRTGVLRGPPHTTIVKSPYE